MQWWLLCPIRGHRLSHDRLDFVILSATDGRQLLRHCHEVVMKDFVGAAAVVALPYQGASVFS